MSSSPTRIDPEIAARFKLVRKHLNLNQAQMGELCEMSPSMVGYIETCKREIPVHALKNLFLRSGISPSFILAVSNEMTAKKSKADTLSAEVAELRSEVEVLRGQLGRISSSITPK